MSQLIKFLNRQTLLVLGICFLISSSFATDSIDLPDDGRLQTSPTFLNLENFEDYAMYTTGLNNFFESKRYAALFELANYDVKYGFLNGVSKDDKEAIFRLAAYSRSYYLAHAKYNLALEDRSDINKSINYCDDALVHLDSYLTQYKELNDKTLNGYLPYLLKAKIFSLLGVLHNGKVSPSDIDEKLIKAFHLLNQAEKIAFYNRISPEKMLSFKLENFSLCFQNAPRLSAEKANSFIDYINKAEDIYNYMSKNKDLSPNDRQLVLEPMKKKLELMQSNLQFKKLQAQASQRQKLPRTLLTKLNDISKRTEQLQWEIKGSKSHSSSPEFNIMFAHQELESVLANRILPSSNETTPLSIIQNIENLIQQQLNPSGPSSLEEIYQYYFKLFKSNGMVDRNNINVCATRPFIEADRLEEARDRLNIIANIERNEKGEIHPATRILKAIVNNMLGNYEEWLELEEEVKEAQLKAEEAKNKDKQRRHNRTVKQIKNAQKNQQNKANPNGNPKQTTQTQSTRRPHRNFETSSDILTNPEPSIPWKEEKEAKSERHKAAESKRAKEAQKEEAAAESNASSEKDELAPVPAPIISPQPLKTIKDCYKLTAAAARVDNEIEENSWKITRGQLENYFKVLGCKVEKNKAKGGHQKVSLPEALYISKGGELITIVNYDFGGALTLPNWDQSYKDGTVPLYLRRSILIARENLVRLHLAAEDASKKED